MVISEVGTLPLGGVPTCVLSKEHVLTDARGQSDIPTAFEMLASTFPLITGAVLAGPMLPGFTLCVAGHILIGVHTPEASFEHDIDGVRRAAARY